MSECYPLIRQESRNADMRRLFGNDYQWFERYLDAPSHASAYNGLSSAQKAFVDAYQGVMVGFLDAGTPSTTGVDTRVRALHFRDRVRDQAIDTEEMDELLAKSDYRGVAFSRYMSRMPASMRSDFGLMMAGMVNGIADAPDGQERYALRETGLARGQRTRILTPAVERALAGVNEGTLAEYLGDGIVGDLENMSNICGPVRPLSTPRCTASDRVAVRD